MAPKGKKNAGKATTKKANKSPKTVDYTKLKKDTRLIPLDEWDWDRVIYSDPVKNDIPDGSGHYRRVRIQYMYDDETIGPAIVELGKHYCFGVQPDNTDKDGNVRKDESGRDKVLRGYRVPIVMTSQTKNSPNEITDSEQSEVDFFDQWREEVIRYSTENKSLLGKGNKKPSWFEDNVGRLLYRKGESDGEIMEGVSPKLYANLIYYSKSKEIGTVFYGPGDKEVNPLSMTGHFHIYPTIRFDSIFIGGRAISLQHRVYDATVEPVARAPKKRLARASKLDASAAEDFNEPASTTSGGDVNDMMESEDEAEAEEESDGEGSDEEYDDDDE